MVTMLLPLGECGWVLDAHAKGLMVVVQLGQGVLQPGKIHSVEVDPTDMALARVRLSWP